MLFHPFPEELRTRASLAKTHHPKSSRPGDKQGCIMMYASTTALSTFAPRCKIRPPCKAQFERSRGLSNIRSADFPPNHPSPPPSALRRPKVLLLNQSTSRPLKAPPPLNLHVNTHRCTSLNPPPCFPKPLTTANVHTPDFRLLPVTLIMVLAPLVPLRNSLSRVFPELDRLGNTLNKLRLLSPLRHQIPHVLSAISIPAMFLLSPHQTKAPQLIWAISIPAMFLLNPHQTKAPQLMRTTIAPSLLLAQAVTRR